VAGQRQGDLIKLRWKAYDGTHIRLIQQEQKQNRQASVEAYRHTGWGTA
jgi:hypothetical protein